MKRYYSHFQTPLGRLYMESDGRSLTILDFDDEGDRGDGAQQEHNLECFAQCRAYLETYFKGTQPEHTPELNPKLTPYQKLVLDETLKIPWGKTKTYGEISKLVAQNTGRKACARAVGNALGRNPIVIIIPCHRVLNASKKLHGFTGGVDKKAMLLDIEGAEFLTHE